MTRMPKIYSGISVSPNFSFVFDSLANSPCKQRSSPKPNGLSDTIQSSLKSLEKLPNRNDLSEQYRSGSFITNCL